MSYAVYILQSCKDNSFYIGYSSNLTLRIIHHNQGLSRYTASKRPWKIVYYEVFSNKKEAICREKFLKQQKNKAFYQRLIDDFNSKKNNLCKK